MKFEVTLKLTVEANNLSDALDLGIVAAEHLNDTFNDNGSINPLMQVDAKELT